MKRFRKLLLSFLAFIIVILTVAIVYSNRIAKKGLPLYDGEVVLHNLSEKVEVYRDKYGTPHIIAQNEADLYRATGYVLAQDRLWQMDLLRRVTLGRLSEIFGDGFVETDLLLRSLQYTKKSEAIIDQSPTKATEAFNAFADGVNQYIDQLKGDYPLEFHLLKYKPEYWEVYHSVNLIGYMAWDLKAGWDELILEKLKENLDSTLFAGLLPQAERHKTTVFKANHDELLANNKLLELDKLGKLGLDILCGSNNWAVSGNKSTTGKPILANDMHLSFSVPGIWMQMHQTIPGKLNVSGLILPGQPLIITGHNDSIAWGMTNTYVDNLDYYEEKINPGNPNQYLFNGEWLDFEIHEEDIKSSSDTVFKRTYRRSHRGPVVSEIKGITNKVITVHWVGDEPSNEILSIYRANRAHNWIDFKNAFRTFHAISQNIAYADVNGNIGLYACAGAPIRKRTGVYGILPGWTDEYDWQRMIPFEELPHEYNPTRGYVSSANNRTVDDSYPYHIGSWYALPYRIDRIREMLEEKEKLSVGDFKQMQNDMKSKYAEQFMVQVFPLIKQAELDNINLKAYIVFEDWNGTMSKDLIAPTLFETTMYAMLINTFKDELGEGLFGSFMKNKNLPRIALYNLFDSPQSAWIDNINTDKKETLSDIVTASFTDAVDTLKKNYGKNIEHWKWKNLHTITLSHPLSKVEVLDKVFKLNRGPYPVDGSSHTVAPYSYPVFEPGNVNHGASHRHVFSLDDWDKTQSAIPTGNSGVVSSEFYCSQTKMFIEGQYHNDVFSEKAVKNAHKYLLVLEPGE